ncbi:MAG: phage/plasmid primase, P4 family, partial [Chloroflexota bacterium]|nr:phage/plasmid primase, P4 family [Chloroflexota bacterium]
HCRDPETGAISQWAREILRAFPHTYRALSPTGTGIRVIGYGQLPGPQHTKPMTGRSGAKQDAKIELFDQGKYTTLTGHRCDGSPLHLGDCQAALDALYEDLWPATPAEATPHREAGPHEEDDDRRLDRARAATNSAEFVALFDAGDTSPYGGDHSGADLALCNHLAFWFGPDPARIDRVFRRSALMRPKWDKRHHGDGRTYGQGTIDEALVGRTEFYQPRQPRLRVVTGGKSGDTASTAATDDPEAPHLTDLGNAQRLVTRHGRDLRYCHLWNKWLAWDGMRWQVDDSGEIVRRAKATVRGIYAEAKETSDPEERKSIARHALRSEADARIKAMISLAQSEPGIPIDPALLDTDPWLLTCLNGTINLRSGELLPHERVHYITKCAPVTHNPEATCPTWLAFLERIMAGDADLIGFLQRAIGYSLTGNTSERVFLILHGAGRNGKSTLLEVFRTLLGPDYAVRTPTDTLLAKREGGIPNDVARLRGARFVSASEADEGRRLAESTIKDLTGGDTISARFMRGEFFDFLPVFKLWLATNHRPVIRGTDLGIWDRIRLVPFSVRIPDDEQDRDLRQKLIAEAPGILAWAVRGCLDWQRHGLGTPSAVRQATAGYRADMDVLGAFLVDRCTIAPQARVAAKTLYADYQRWCEETGEKPLSQIAVGKQLAERGFTPARSGKGRGRGWIGLGLLSETDEEGLSTGDRSQQDSHAGGGPPQQADVFGGADTSGRKFRHNSSPPKNTADIPKNASQSVRPLNASALDGGEDEYEEDGAL